MFSITVWCLFFTSLITSLLTILFKFRPNIAFTFFLISIFTFLPIGLINAYWFAQWCKMNKDPDVKNLLTVINKSESKNELDFHKRHFDELQITIKLKQISYIYKLMLCSLIRHNIKKQEKSLKNNTNEIFVKI